MDVISKSFVPNTREYIVKDLSKLSRAQLLELKDRQEAILRNKTRLAKLPDKGKRIDEFYAKILHELRQKEDVDRAAELFSVLNISAVGTKFTTNLEWTGDMQAHPAGTDIVQLDIEDETDPLKILAQSREKAKIVKVEKPEESLITPEDLRVMEEVKKLNLLTCQLDNHATYLCGMEQFPADASKDKFRPYQTTTSNVHDPEKEILKVFKHSEITAATPPLLRHPGTKMLSLQESIDLQFVKEKEIKEIQRREAELRLVEKAKKTKARDFVAKDMSEFFKTYRVVNESSEEETSDEEWDSAEEVLDIDARDEPGGVNFTVQE